MMTHSRGYAVGLGIVVIGLFLSVECNVAAGYDLRFNRKTTDQRKTDEQLIRRIMAEARRISSLITKRNGKAFIVIDKRNFQFYQYDRNGDLFRIGPVAIGKGITRAGDFETPVGVYTIRGKQDKADGIIPDWFFRERNIPIPVKREERRVPRLLRYKLLVDDVTYIHYTEATGGRLTHGSVGLDWMDAEAVFAALEVGSYCIIIDDNFLKRLERSEFPITRESKP